MSVTFIRTLILYVAVICAVRIMGKRQLGELSPTELVVTFLVSNIAILPIEDTNLPLMAGLISIFTLVVCEVILSDILLKSPLMRKIVSGSPRVIIKDGVIDQKQLKQLRLSADDLTALLRGQNCFDVGQVAFAVLETTGQLNLYQKFEDRPVTPKDLGQSPPPDSDAPPLAVISDGIVSAAALAFIGQDENWLDARLRQQGCMAEQVFLLLCDRSGRFDLILREEKK